MSDMPVFVVSGGSRGLGLAVVERLLERPACVATCSRSRSEGIERVEARYAERFWHAELDLADPEGVRRFAADVYQRFGRLDGLINNAAVAHDGVLALAGAASIQQMLQINLSGAVFLVKECIRYMLLGGGGSVVNISSVVAQRGFSGLSVYSATKAGLEGLTRALARELGPRNIRVNAVAPGYLETEMSSGLSDSQRQQITRRTPLGRLGRVEDVLPCIEFLLSPDSRFITGQVLTVDGGMSV